MGKLCRFFIKTFFLFTLVLHINVEHAHTHSSPRLYVSDISYKFAYATKKHFRKKNIIFFEKKMDRIQQLEKNGAAAMMKHLILEAEEPLPITVVENKWDEIRSRIKKNSFEPDYDIISKNPERVDYRSALQTRLLTNTEVGTLFNV